MTILCVDDEQLVLDLTVTLCRELRQKPEVCGFASAQEVLSWLDGNRADIAILDINMPDMDGLLLAARIKEKRPSTCILFVTGYSQYAMDALQMHAAGYLMKPISLKRLQEEVDYIEETLLKPQAAREREKKIEVRTFGEFDVFVDGVAVNFSRSKAKELLAYLVDRRGVSITRPTAHAVLWEDGEYDRAMQKQLDVIIRSLKDTLSAYGISEILEISKGNLRVCPEKFTCDLYRFLDGRIDAVNAYRGEYMSAYSWASLTEAYMDRVNNNAKS